MPLCQRDIAQRSENMSKDSFLTSTMNSENITGIPTQTNPLDINIVDTGLFLNESSVSNWSVYANISLSQDRERGWFLHEFQLIKAIVLVIVISALIISTCRLVLKNFSRYSVARSDDQQDI